MNQQQRLTIQARREDIPKAALESEFVTMLCLQESGGLVLRLSEEVTDVIRAVQEHGKKGTVQVAIKLSPAGGRKIECEVITKIAAPKEPNEATILYADDHGQVYGADPDQLLLNLSAKTVPMAPAKEVPVAQS